MIISTELSAIHRNVTDVVSVGVKLTLGVFFAILLRLLGGLGAIVTLLHGNHNLMSSMYPFDDLPMFFKKTVPSPKQIGGDFCHKKCQFSALSKEKSCSY